MAILAFMIGSVTGSFMAFMAFLFLGMPAGAAVLFYICASGLIGSALLFRGLSSPSPPPDHQAAA